MNAQVESAGGEWTAREIAQQPVVWPQIATLVSRERGRLDSFLAPLLANARLRIVLSGAGTSSHIGGVLAPALSRHLHRRVDMVATTDLVSGPALYLQRDVPTLLVSFARSGSSPESVAAVEIAERALDDVHHLVVTCNAAGALAARMSKAGNACVLVLPEATHDRAFAMTSSFTGMVLAAALSFGLIRSDRVQRLATACAGLLPIAGTLAQELSARRFERAVFLGSNELQSLAAESALKMLELTDGNTVAVSQSVLGFRHGPKTVVNGKTLIVVFVSNDAYTRSYDLDLIRELIADARNGALVVVGARDARGAIPGGSKLLEIGDLHGASDVELALVAVVFAQVLALRQSLQFGLTPDNPNASGVVSRVVQGVIIHPWTPGGGDVPGS